MKKQPYSEKRIQQLTQLGLIIAYYRKLRGMNQETLADRVNISRTYLSFIEASQKPTAISLPLLFDIADALEVNPCDLLNFHA